MTSLQLRLQVGHVVVPVAVARSLAEAHAVYDACVVQLVADDRILFSEQGFEHASVGVKAGCVKNRVLHAEKAAELGLEFLVDVLGAANEPYAGHAEAISFEPAPAGGDQFRVVGQSEVIVGAKIEHFPSVFKPDRG